MNPLRFSRVWLGLLLAMLAIAFWAVPPVARSQSVITATPGDVQVSFPDQISFDLAATSEAAPITEVKLLYGAVRREALTITNVDITPDQRIELRHILDTQVNYFPPGTEIAYRWLVRDEDGNELETPMQTLILVDQRFAWQSLSDRGVTVYWYDGGTAFGRQLLETATRTLDRLEREIGATLEQNVNIYIYADTWDMRAALRANSAEWIGGVAYTDLGIIIGAIAPDNDTEVGRLLPHELSHQVLHQATDNPYGGMPVWFDEGLAVYNQEVLDVGFTDLVADAARENALIPLEALTSSFPADPDLAVQSYAQSRSVVDYLIKAYGEEKMQELVETFSQATPIESALQNVFDRSIDELDAEWRATLPEPLVAAPMPQPTTAVAPADRLMGEPVLPENVDALPAPPLLPSDPDTPEASSSWLANIPNTWLLGLATFSCVATIVIISVIVLVALRLIGVDKRTN